MARRHPNLARLAALLLLALVTMFASCNRLSPGRPAAFVPGAPTIGDGGIGASSQVQIDHPLYAGLARIVAGDGIIDLGWDAASDDHDSAESLRYRVYVSPTSGDQVFAAPVLETAPGVTSSQLTGLPNNVPVYIVVRAVDTEGNEDVNTVEWLGLPNPVLFVGPSGGGAPDGLTPTSAFATVGQAVSAGIPLNGVNIYVAGGSYPENVFLFPGMAIYGGFTASFVVSDRDFVANPTQFSSTFPVDLVTMLPGNAPVSIDGCVMSGNNINEAGVIVDNVPFQITNCEVRDMVIHGVEIRSDVAEADAVTGTLRGCSVIRSGGEGVLIIALGDITIDNNQITQNGNEGVESQWLYTETGNTTRIELTRNRILDNGDEGIDLDFAELSETDPSLSQGGRIRVLIRANDIRRNSLAGVQLDLDFENSDGIDFEARIEDNRISSNRGDGISLDGDARGSFRMARNVITANSLVGVSIDGSPDGPWCRILNSRLLGNGASGILVRDHAGVEVRNCAVGYNGNGAVRSPRSFVDVVNTLLVGNGGAASEISTLRYSTVFAEPLPATPGVNVSTADPRLELWPSAVRHAVGAAGAAEILITETTVFAVGDTVELRDDGVPRTVESVAADRIAFSPPLESATVVGDAVFAYGTSLSVMEREGFFDGSPAIDGGDPLESDRDASVADQGPVGGDTPGNVGIETGLASESVPTEVEQVIPLPSLLIPAASITVQYRRPVDAAFESSVSLTVGGAPSGVTFSAAATDELSFSASNPGSAGLRFGIDLAPVAGSAPDADDRQPHHVRFDYLLAAVDSDVDPVGGDINGSVASAQPVVFPTIVTGAIGIPGDSDHYRMTLQAGDVFYVDLIAGRRESILIANVSILSSDGSVVFSASAAEPPISRDPELAPFTVPADGDYVVRVGSVDASGSAAAVYELQVSTR